VDVKVLTVLKLQSSVFCLSLSGHRERKRNNSRNIKLRG